MSLNKQQQQKFFNKMLNSKIIAKWSLHVLSANDNNLKYLIEKLLYFLLISRKKGTFFQEKIFFIWFFLLFTWMREVTFPLTPFINFFICMAKYFLFFCVFTIQLKIFRFPVELWNVLSPTHNVCNRGNRAIW